MIWRTTEPANTVFLKTVIVQQRNKNLILQTKTKAFVDCTHFFSKLECHMTPARSICSVQIILYNIEEEHLQMRSLSSQGHNLHYVKWEAKKLINEGDSWKKKMQVASKGINDLFNTPVINLTHQSHSVVHYRSDTGLFQNQTVSEGFRGNGI